MPEPGVDRDDEGREPRDGEQPLAVPTPPESDPVESATEYRLRPAVAVRVVGLGCVGLVVPVVLEIGRRTAPFLDVPVVTLVVWLCLALVAVVVLTGVWLLLDRRPRLQVDRDGFTNRTVYGRRGTSAPWKDVRGVRRASTTIGPVLVVQLGDERTTTILPRYLDASLSAIESQLRSRLNTAYGYRPLS